jgi:hypothetical protein
VASGADKIKNWLAKAFKGLWKGLTQVVKPALTPPADRYASMLGVTVGGVLFVVFGLLFFSTLVELLPAVEEQSGQATGAQSHAVVLGWGIYTAHLTKSTGLLVLALLMGAIGGYIHAATSFVSYIGNREFKASWGWWYGLRALIGAALALLLYLAFRAGFLTAGSSTAVVDPYGVAAISGLAGLFSKQATDKLEEIFNTAFHTTAGVGDSHRRDTISASPAPSSAEVSSSPAGTPPSPM